MTDKKRSVENSACRAPAWNCEGPLNALQVKELWTAYIAHRADLRLRNRLVEHYLPAVRHLAATMAKRMQLRDRENAVGEVLVALVVSIVPGYDGKGCFDGWAFTCIRSKLIDQLRKEHKHRLGRGMVRHGLEMLPSRDDCRGDMKFVEVTAQLSDRQAAVLWMRYYRRMTTRAVAEMLKTSPSHVHYWTESGVAALKKNWADLKTGDLST